MYMIYFALLSFYLLMHTVYRALYIVNRVLCAKREKRESATASRITITESLSFLTYEMDCVAVTAAEREMIYRPLI